MDPGTALAIGTGVNIVGGIIGGRKAASAAQDQAIQQAEATQARHQYDLDMWDMKKKQLQAERSEAVDRLMTEARNEGKIRAYKDVANQERYDYDLKIRNAQQAGNEAAYERSEDIYRSQTSLNDVAAKASMDSEIVKLEEGYNERAFDRQESYLDMLEAEGRLRARASSGRSAVKGMQATMGDWGRQMAMLNETAVSADRNLYAVLQNIIRDKSSADLTAYASRMLEPGELPMPLKQRPIPIAEYNLPRILVESDFGPQPVRGFMASPGAAADMVWGQTISSIAGAVGSGLTSYAGSRSAGGFKHMTGDARY